MDATYAQKYIRPFSKAFRDIHHTEVESVARQNLMDPKLSMSSLIENFKWLRVLFICRVINDEGSNSRLRASNDGVRVNN
jgi:hypothetical protein